MEHLEKMMEEHHGKSKAPPMTVGEEHEEGKSMRLKNMEKSWKNTIRLKLW